MRACSIGKLRFLILDNLHMGKEVKRIKRKKVLLRQNIDFCGFGRFPDFLKVSFDLNIRKLFLETLKKHFLTQPRYLFFINSHSVSIDTIA